MLDDSVPGDVWIHEPSGLVQSSFLWIAAGYAVHDGGVVLVLHNRFKYWVPPGGHIEAGDTPGRAAEREFLEETGLEAIAVSAAGAVREPDSNAKPEPVPFYTDIEIEGFRRPAFAQFFFLKLTNPGKFTLADFQGSELDGIGVFTLPELDALSTFDQVKELSRYVLQHHPSPTSSR